MSPRRIGWVIVGVFWLSLQGLALDAIASAVPSPGTETDRSDGSSKTGARRETCDPAGSDPTGEYSAAGEVSPNPRPSGYTITDLGGDYDQACSINDRGEAVGVHAEAAEGYLPHPVMWWKGRRIDLGNLGGAGGSAVSISPSGLVAGWATRPDGFGDAFVWRHGVMTDLGSLGGGGQAYALNSRGDVVGFCWTAGTYHAVLWRDGRVIDLGALGGDVSFAIDINSRGDIAGVALTDEGVQHAVVWRNGRITDLGSGSVDSTASFIDDDGGIWGTHGGHAAVWTHGTRIDLGTLGGDWSAISAVNARGQAVGQSDVDGVAYRAVLWENGEMVDLLPGTTHSQAAAINEPGQIVVNDGSHAWLWQKGSMFELPELGLPDAYGYSGTAINSRGDIVGIFMLPGGKRHACLWQKTGPARQVGAPSIDAVINAVAAP